MPVDNYAGTGHTFDELQALKPLTRGRVLVDAYVHLAAVVATFNEQFAEARQMVYAYAEEERASVIDGTDHELHIGSTAGSYDWEYNLEKLTQLGAYLPPDVVDQALEPVPATIKVKKGELNKLAKRGGKIAEIIDAGCTKVPKPGSRTLDIVRRNS